MIFERVTEDVSLLISGYPRKGSSLVEQFIQKRLGIYSKYKPRRSLDNLVGQDSAKPCTRWRGKTGCPEEL